MLHRLARALLALSLVPVALHAGRRAAGMTFHSSRHTVNEAAPAVLVVSPRPPVSMLLKHQPDYLNAHRAVKLLTTIETVLELMTAAPSATIGALLQQLNALHEPIAL